VRRTQERKLATAAAPRSFAAEGQALQKSASKDQASFLSRFVRRGRPEELVLDRKCLDMVISYQPETQGASVQLDIKALAHRLFVGRRRLVDPKTMNETSRWWFAIQTWTFILDT